MHHAAMIRNDLAWDEYWRWDLDELTAAVYYDQLTRATRVLIVLDFGGCASYKRNGLYESRGT